MKVEQRFEVPASSAETYELLIDLERVASCIPGGEVGPREPDGSHPASIAVKLGPMRMLYKGRVQVGELDSESMRAVLEADVREQRGQGAAKAKMSMLVTQTSSGSLVETVTEVTLTGRAAQMGQGIVNDVADRLVADMAACIAGRLAPADGAVTGAAADSGPASGAETGAQVGGGPPNRAATSAQAGSGRAVPPPPQAPPVKGFSLLMRVLWERVKRAFTRKGGTK